ncbi:hypothetical protein DFH28DRAFT_928716 [Melampsora americana]|nr:hypothetical protein DFH28DRAFT_928716 [Melampsora americana]
MTAIRKRKLKSQDDKDLVPKSKAVKGHLFPTDIQSSLPAYHSDVTYSTDPPKNTPSNIGSQKIASPGSKTKTPKKANTSTNVESAKKPKWKGYVLIEDVEEEAVQESDKKVLEVRTRAKRQRRG